MKLLMLSVP